MKMCEMKMCLNQQAIIFLMIIITRQTHLCTKFSNFQSYTFNTVSLFVCMSNYVIMCDNAQVQQQLLTLN